MCVLISFIYNLGLTIKPIKGPPQGVYACPHNKKLATLLNNEQCVCVCVFPSFPLSFSKTFVSSLLHPGCESTSFLGAGSSGLSLGAVRGPWGDPGRLLRNGSEAASSEMAWQFFANLLGAHASASLPCYLMH